MILTVREGNCLISELEVNTIIQHALKATGYDNILAEFLQSVGEKEFRLMNAIYNRGTVCREDFL